MSPSFDQNLLTLSVYWRKDLVCAYNQAFFTRINWQPSMTNLAFPPVEIKSTLEQPEQTIVDCEWLNIASLIVEQNEHLTSIKYEFGCWTKRFSLWLRFSSSDRGYNRSLAIGMILRLVLVLLYYRLQNWMKLTKE